MLHKFVKLARFLIDLRALKAFIGIRSGGYLYEMGWFNSLHTKSSIDLEGYPLPWVTYPFIEFIEPKLNNKMKVFEYGSGNSSYYYALRVRSIEAVEHDFTWFKRMEGNSVKNLEIIFRDLGNDDKYSRAIKEKNLKYDIVIIDGRDRVNCIINSIESLSDDGVLVLDDSERAEYSAGIEYLLKNNFRGLDFWGVSPGLYYRKCTSLYYRDDNCLGV